MLHQDSSRAHTIVPIESYFHPSHGLAIQILTVAHISNGEDGTSWVRDGPSTPNDPPRAAGAHNASWGGYNQLSLSLVSLVKSGILVRFLT